MSSTTSEPVSTNLNAMSSLALFVLVALFASVELVQVNVQQGILEGEVLTTIIGNKTYYSYKGVPYAAPPVGSLRFKAPQPPSNWDGVRDASSHGASCPQIDVLSQSINEGSEDCLFLNVYTPNLSPRELLAVIVYIHGGSFMSGSGNSSTCGPDFVMLHDVVLVTLNYRLEALGFAAFDIEDFTGNAGLKDQAAALYWVQKNIDKFGGDPNKVTIMGQSAGSVSVGYHIASPKSKGLFQRAIGSSGSPFAEFATTYKPYKRTSALGKQLGINTHNSTELLNYLQNVTVSSLYNTNCTVLTSDEKMANLIKLYSFVPIVEKDLGENTFMTKDVIDIFRNGDNNKVDVMYGYLSQESSTLVDVLNSAYLTDYDNFAELFTPLKLYYKNTPDVNYEIACRIREYYFGDASLDANVLEKFIQFTSDETFVLDIIRFMTILKQNKRNHYLYKFSAVSGLNTYGSQAAKYGLNGNVGHLDDLNYVFQTGVQNMSLLVEGSTEMKLVNLWCTLITNFAKYGNPTPDKSSIGVVWPKYDASKRRYLEIGNSVSVKSNPEADMVAFWKSIYEYGGSEF